MILPFGASEPYHQTSCSIGCLCYQNTTASTYAISEGVQQSFSTINLIPIELLSFNGFCLNNSIHMEWITATESDIVSFLLEKSQDGYHFEEMIQLPAQGYSNQKQSYHYQDISSSEITYYRLSQTDINNHNKNLKIIAVPCQNKKSENTIKIYPNPCNDYLKIKSEDLIKTISLYDTGGRLIFYETLSNFEKEISMSFLSNGIYLLKATTSSEVLTFKIHKNDITN